ncbi:hypothetical protein KEC55_08580 [Burkholderia cepacia]|uniref:hypothetical protein n=1 Tax=Burkholderia cepacia TaxID=292 RepID=UPI00249F67C8|nr:hypothetical protein [Burkholderia cepacia]WGY66926.1 hypothetical protein KEC55_08580 [Burkholderia cepacia]
MAVSDEIVGSMTAIMTAFARRENRSMLNQPFRNGKARGGTCVATAVVRGASLSIRESALAQRSNDDARAAGRIEAVSRHRAPVSETRHVF